MSGQIIAHGPNLACHLFLYSLQAKDGFYHFKWLKKSGKGYFVMWKNYMKFKFQCL